MANKKITDLVDIGTPESGDLLEIVDISEGVSKRVAVSALGGGSTPTLQEVTDEGNTTTNSIFVNTLGLFDEAGDEYLMQSINDKLYLITNQSGTESFFGIDFYVGGISLFSINNSGKAITLQCPEVLTEDRAITFKDESGTVALTTDIPAAITIDATPTDGSANAVSSNGVFDALALKADLNRTEQYIISKGVGNYGSVTGTVAETVILSIPFLGGDFEIGDYLGFNIWTTKVGTAGATNITLRAGTTGTTADSVLSILQSHTTGQSSVASLRQGILFETGNFINGRTRPIVNAVSIDVGSFVNSARFSLNPSNNWFLTFTVQHAVSTDVINVSSYQVTKTKTF